jgi:hypothetical protein
VGAVERNLWDLVGFGSVFPGHLRDTPGAPPGDLGGGLTGQGEIRLMFVRNLQQEFSSATPTGQELTRTHAPATVKVKLDSFYSERAIPSRASDLMCKHTR